MKQTRQSSQFSGASRVLLLLAIACACSCRLSGQSTPPSNRAILERLDQLENQNRELLQEIKALREMIANKNQPQSAAAEPTEQQQRVEEVQAINQNRIEELAQTKVEAANKFPIQLTGTLLMNAFWNGAFSGGFQNPTAASLNPVTAAIGASFRQTVLGLTFHGPQTFLGGTVSGSVYMDFFGGSDQTLNHLFRLRLATIQFDWPNTTFAIGQDKPLVSRREPNSLAQVGVSPLTGSGNPWLWRPQVRVEQRFRLSDRSTIKAEGGIFQTAENAYLTPGATVRLAPSRPGVEARVAMRHEVDENHIWEVAPVLHFSSSHANGYSVPSRLFGVDWLYKPMRQLEVTGLAFRGQNFGNLGALAGITVAPNNTAKAIRGSGGWLQVRYLATSRLTFNVYGGLEDDFDRDLPVGRIGNNRYLAGNVMYLLAPNVITSFEVGRNRTTYVGAGNRFNTHYDLAIGYLF